MKLAKKSLIGALLAASALAAPGTAMAQSASKPSHSEIGARLNKLEAEMKALRADLAASEAENAQLKALAEAAENKAGAAEAKAAEAGAKVAAIEAKPAADGFRAGTTTIKLGGYVKLLAGSDSYSDGEVTTNTFGRDFYLAQTIPTAGGAKSRSTDFTAKQSRFWLNLATDVAGHSLKGYVETDFQTSPGAQGSQRTTNGYNLALRRAYMQVDKWTFGQDWTTFQYTGALPESTDYVGGAEGTVFVRQPLVRYSAPMGKGMTLHLSAENPESATAAPTAPALVENGDDAMPDFAARLAYAGKRTELSLGTLLREVRVSTAGVKQTTDGYGVSLGGKYFFNDAKTGDARFMVTYGENIGRYVGLNFAPDAIYNATTNSFSSVKELAAIGAVRIPLTSNVRANIMGAYQKVDYASSLAAADIGGFNKSAWSVAGNIFYSPIKNVDLGIEYRHGKRELVSGAAGTTDRMEIAAKYSF